VVLDEPISGLDPVQIVEMRALVRQLGESHTVIVSSHILSEISETCDRIFVIQHGEILWSGKEADLSSEVEHGMRIRLTVRVAGASPTAALERARALVTGIAGVRAVESREPSEAGDGIASLEVVSDSDARDALCRALVSGDVGVLEVSRLRDLETTFRALLEEGAPS
jgi:ABC-2 type transport system ATP-binding protein